MPVFDTDFLIAADRGDVQAVHLLTSLRTEERLVPAIVAVEFAAGIPDRVRAIRYLEEFGRILQTDDTWVQTAAERKAGLRGKGGRVRSADFWISCWAILHDTYVITRNVKDFEALGVKARSW